jgi:hypothetical protein
MLQLINKVIIAISGVTAMQTVNIAELINNLSACPEQVKNGEELIVKDRNRPLAPPYRSLQAKI